MTSDNKSTIRRLRRVFPHNESKTLRAPNLITISVIKALESSDTIKCRDFNEYIRLVNSELPD